MPYPFQPTIINMEDTSKKLKVISCIEKKPITVVVREIIEFHYSAVVNELDDSDIESILRGEATDESK